MQTSRSNVSNIRHLTSAVSSHATVDSSQDSTWIKSCLCGSKAPISKGILMILLWNTLVGMTYGFVLLLPANLIFKAAFSEVPWWILFNIYLGAHCLIGLVQILYPIGGLIADVRCGRYRIITLSLFNIWCGSLLSIVIGVTFSVANFNHIPGYTLH